MGAFQVPLFYSVEKAMDLDLVTQRVRELVEPLLSSRHAHLVELLVRPAGSRLVLTFLVDTAMGIRLDELRHLNQAIGALLDEHEVIPSAYLLEVSSPGLDRPLKSTADFERVIARRIKVFTWVPVNMKREYVGELLGANEETILLRLDSGAKQQIRLSEIARAVQEVDL